MLVKEKQLSIQILTPCTLNCRLCADFTPLYRERGEHYFDSVENFQREIDALFQVYDYIEDLTITGGEPLMHKQLPEMLSITLRNYASHFKCCRIFSNGTILPSKELLNVIKNETHDNFEFVIDHYGEVSKKADETARILTDNQINCRINRYFGEDQYCGGWVDYGSPSIFRNYSRSKVEEIVKHCHNATWKCLILFKGKVYLCVQAAFGSDMGFFQLAPDEYIDLFDDCQPLEEKRNVASLLGKKATTACQYCNSFDIERSQRFPAGEQI